MLSLGTDLGLGQPMEHVLRQCLIALRLAESLGVDEEERAVVYYTALLAWVGCHVDAHEQSTWFGDELVMKAAVPLVDFDGPRSEVAFFIGHLGAGRPPLERLRLGLAFLTGEGRRTVTQCSRTTPARRIRSRSHSALMNAFERASTMCSSAGTVEACTGFAQRRSRWQRDLLRSPTSSRSITASGDPACRCRGAHAGRDAV